MKQDITNITILFKGTAKGKRKIDIQSERLDQLTGHVLLTPDQFNDYERKAWALLESKGYKNYDAGKINVNHGENEDGMTSVMLLPKQSQLISK